jgi:Domain of unknown function (DUF4276)
MNELYAFCEGPTEQGFCKQLLQLHLFPQHEGTIHPIKIAHSKSHGKVSRGGVRSYQAIHRDIINTLKSRRERHVFFTTMIDLYALPNDFPGKQAQQYDPVNPTPYVKHLEDAFGKDIGDTRFIPYLQLHEFETMLFADPEAFRAEIENCDHAIEQLETIVEIVASIEHINDGPTTAPSKRIITFIPEYERRKASAGPRIAERIGLAVIREKCPHFHEWLTRLEGLWK